MMFITGKEEVTPDLNPGPITVPESSSTIVESSFSVGVQGTPPQFAVNCSVG
jgi:hypothetical protein